ncbi:hypothetical protein C7999DRAFT_41468 [Corynascus novoguineensis]|uniref:Uncharacterized protein n=1 Tax=Corynascus novoguineensis TaxID=1126955 RepID=A0AAN7CSJ3_9PEZI|nr:hypothetical protein C7999DRAFT_41468 [Corynascus novoguineensis]
MENLRRAAVEQDQLSRVFRIKEHLETLNTCVLDQANLETLGVIIDYPLNVDSIRGPWNLGPRFFEPWVSSELLTEAGADWLHTWEAGIITDHKLAGWQCGEIRAQWFHGCLKNLYKLNSELWEPWKVDPYTLREGTGLDLALHRFDFFDDLTGQYSDREYEPEAAFFPVDKAKPHVDCFVIDSKIEPDNQVLCSEVYYAAELVRFRLEKGEHSGHHTKPGIIYTLQRDLFTRITQAHFDGKTNKLVLRRSRRLELRGPKPTSDAYLLVRCMASRPVGETEYIDEVEAPDDETTSNDSPDTASKFLLGCA